MARTEVASEIRLVAVKSLHDCARRPDVVIGMHLLTNYLAPRVSKKAGTPLVVLILGPNYEMIPWPALRPIGKIIERRTLKEADSVIVMFVESLVGGSPPPISAEEGREAVRIMGMVVARYREKYGHRLEPQNES